LDWASAIGLLLTNKITIPNPIATSKLYIIMIVDYHNI
jgi:hypothetical protein